VSVTVSGKEVTHPWQTGSLAVTVKDSGFVQSFNLTADIAVSLLPAEFTKEYHSTADLNGTKTDPWLRELIT
jgi:hypothetical protein